MPSLWNVLGLTLEISFLGFVFSIPGLLLLITGNQVLVLIGYAWLALSGIFASVYVLTGWVERRGGEKQLEKWKSRKQERNLEKTYEEQYKEEIEKRKRERLRHNVL